MNKRLKHSAVGAFSLLLIFVAVLCGLTWREVQRQRLDHALIAAIKRSDTATALAALKAGANPNARDRMPVYSVKQILLDLLPGKHRALPEKNCALSLVFWNLEDILIKAGAKR